MSGEVAADGSGGANGGGFWGRYAVRGHLFVRVDQNVQIEMPLSQKTNFTRDQES